MAMLEQIKVNADYHSLQGMAQRKWGFTGSTATKKPLTKPFSKYMTFFLLISWTEDYLEGMFSTVINTTSNVDLNTWR